MEIKEPTWADIDSIMERLSDQHRAEYSNVGWPGERFMAMMAQFMTEGDTKALYFDGKPQAVLGIRNTVQYGPITWLACTKQFFEAGAGPTRACRRYMKEAVKRHRRIMSFVGSDHPCAAKWMKVIGFELVEERPDVKIFQYT